MLTTSPVSSSRTDRAAQIRKKEAYQRLLESEANRRWVSITDSPEDVARAWRETDDPQKRKRVGRKLREIRARIVASGEPLLSWDEVSEEIARRRGEI